VDELGAQLGELFQRHATLEARRPLSGRQVARVSPSIALREGLDELEKQYAEKNPDRDLVRWLTDMGLTRARVAKEPDRPGRRGNPEWFYAVVVMLYVAAVERRSPSPNKDVASRLNTALGTAYSSQYVSNTINRLRGKLIEDLENPERRQPGGKPTPQCLRALAGADPELLDRLGLTDG
jgi:hypothetical protein